MKSNNNHFQRIISVFILIMLLGYGSYGRQSSKKKLIFKDYPDIKLGVTTQNFLKALPFNVPSLAEIIEYVSKEGFQFIEIRDQFVDLSIEDCKLLSKVAQKNRLEVIYVFNKNLLDPSFSTYFDKALANVLVFKGPGILRALASKSEFDANTNKKGWTKEEFAKLVRISDSCVQVCESKHIRLIYENSNEAFFGDSPSYFGLTDLLTKSPNAGLQLDIANLFRKTARVKNEPTKVLEYLKIKGIPWVETHLKSVIDGEAQTTLTDNPLAVEKVIALMGKQNVKYAAIELTTVEDKEQCFDNHKKSIKYLLDKGLLKE